jgi:Flp pilus assembly protein TadB
VEYFLIGVTVLVAIQTVREAWRAGGDDPIWDLQWRALTADDRARLAVAGLSPSSTSALEDPEERKLAEGFSRQERRLRSHLELVLLAALVLAVALTLVGIATHHAVALIIGTYAVLKWGIDVLRDRQIKRRVRTAIASAAGPAPTTAP